MLRGAETPHTAFPSQHSCQIYTCQKWQKEGIMAMRYGFPLCGCPEHPHRASGVRTTWGLPLFCALHMLFYLNVQKNSSCFCNLLQSSDRTKTAPPAYAGGAVFVIFLSESPPCRRRGPASRRCGRRGPSLRQGIGHEELQLAGLVAAAGPLQQVVPLDIEVGAAQGPGQVGQKLDGGLIGGVPPAALWRAHLSRDRRRPGPAGGGGKNPILPADGPAEKGVWLI